MKNLCSTPNFDGLPCLQRLTLFLCEKLQEMHPSLGKHTSLEFVSVSLCGMLRMFPTIVHMKKLETLAISHCHESLEFPVIKSNMESLVRLYLGHMGIDILLSSIGYHCPNLNSLVLVDCSYLKYKKVNFHGLKHLEEAGLHGPYRWKIPNYVRSQFSNFWLRLVLPQLKHSLRKLDLGGCQLKDGEIPFDICELSNLHELDLSRNGFTRLDFSLLQFTRLKTLTLSYCKRLVELPKLPSGVVIFVANGCKSLKTVGDFYPNCKWLCQVSLKEGGVVTDGSRLLQSMLDQGNANEKLSMILALQGLEIAKRFRPPLVRGQKCGLQLPENWSNDFSGFLMCAVGDYALSLSSRQIGMQRVLNGMVSKDGVVWEESDNDKRTCVWYVSFASIRNTAWWNTASKEVLFSVGHEDTYQPSFSGFGVSLVAKKSGNGSGLLETSTREEESEFLKYTPEFIVLEDSTNAIEVELHSSLHTM